MILQKSSLEQNKIEQIKQSTVLDGSVDWDTINFLGSRKNLWET